MRARAQFAGRETEGVRLPIVPTGAVTGGAGPAVSFDEVVQLVLEMTVQKKKRRKQKKTLSHEIEYGYFRSGI